MTSKLWLGKEPLVLASKSEVRRKILAAAAIPAEIAPAAIDERDIETRSGLTDPAKIAALLAREKAHAVAASRAGRLVLGADQTLALGTKRFSKPKDHEGAVAQLRNLSGQAHALHSAIALCRDGKVLFEHYATARLTMRPLKDEMIARYLAEAGDAALSSVGAYQIEGPGIHLFDKVDGDYFTILGLPILPLLAFLRGEGLIAT